MHFEGLDEDLQKRVRALADLRKESVEQVLKKHNSEKLIRRIPNHFGTLIPSLIGQDFADAGVRNNIPYVKLHNERIFYGHPSRNNLIRAFELVQDLCSPVLTAETCGVAMDVSFRYLTDSAWYPSELLPRPGGSIVEVGAYCGHKTIKFVDKLVGTQGKILGIEMMPDNMYLLRLNVEENKLGHTISLQEKGVWSEPGRQTVLGKGFQQNSLVSIDNRDFVEKAEVPTDTLDNILSDFDVPVIDFIDIRVNGAEIEVLEGLDQALDKVKIIFVATPYSRGGEATNEICLALLKRKGCKLLRQSVSDQIYAVSPGFASEFENFVVEET